MALGPTGKMPVPPETDLFNSPYRDEVMTR